MNYFAAFEISEIKHCGRRSSTSHVYHESFNNEKAARDWIMTQTIKHQSGGIAYIIHDGHFILHEHFGYTEETGYSGYSGFCGCVPLPKKFSR